MERMGVAGSNVEGGSVLPLFDSRTPAERDESVSAFEASQKSTSTGQHSSLRPASSVLSVCLLEFAMPLDCFST